MEIFCIKISLYMSIFYSNMFSFFLKNEQYKAQYFQLSHPYQDKIFINLTYPTSYFVILSKLVLKFFRVKYNEKDSRLWKMLKFNFFLFLAFHTLELWM